MSWLLPVALVFVQMSAVQAADGPVAESHCVVFVVDQLDDGQLVTSEPVCFIAERMAVWWAASDPDNLLDSVDASGGGLVAPTFTLGQHFDGFNGTGSSISVVGGSCTGGWWNTPPSWDNRISSSYNGCARLQHWDLPSKLGASESTYGAGTTDNLSLLNNKAESVSYHSS